MPDARDGRDYSVYVIGRMWQIMSGLCGRAVRRWCIRSLKQRLLYLHASMIFAHTQCHAFLLRFQMGGARFVQDRIRAVNTCIQHGLSVQDLTVDSQPDHQ